MRNKKQLTTTGNRIYFLDNLRTFIIFLVILYHAGGVYESTGGWASFWIVDDLATNDLAGLLNVVLDIIVMPTIFFISGYFMPLSLRKKSGWEFLKGKFRRLIVPWLIAVFTLIPLYKVIFLASRNLPQESWTSYFHFSSGNISGQSWLWFLPVLFAFNLLYLALLQVNLIPTKMSMKTAVIALFSIGFISSFGLDMLHAQGWTLSALVDFQNERVLLYFMMFLLGSLCFCQQIFATKPEQNKGYTAVKLTAWIPAIIYIAFLIMPIITQTEAVISQIVDSVVLWLTFHLTMLALLYLLIELFRRNFDQPGRIWHELNQNSYNVYIIHMIVLGGIALLLLNTAVPSMVKYLTLTISTILVSNIIVSFYRRATTLRKTNVSTKRLGGSLGQSSK